MSSFHPIKPLSRPTTPDRTSWFEFLLDAFLLEKHLSGENPGIYILFKVSISLKVFSLKTLDNHCYPYI